MRLDDYMNAVAAEAAQDEWNEQQSEYIEELEHRIQELEQMIDLQQRDSRVFAILILALICVFLVEKYYPHW